MANGILGNLFDIDHDGELSTFEKAGELAFIAMAIEDEIAEDAEDAEDMEDLEDAENVEDEWRLEYYGNEYGIDPDLFDTKENFLDAYNNKKLWVDDIDYDIKNFADARFIDPVDYDTYDEFIAAVKDSF